MKRLTNVIDSYPQFSKDGKLLLFQSNRSGKMQIYVSKAMELIFANLPISISSPRCPVGLPT